MFYDTKLLLYLLDVDVSFCLYFKYLYKNSVFSVCVFPYTTTMTNILVSSVLIKYHNLYLITTSPSLLFPEDPLTKIRQETRPTINVPTQVICFYSSTHKYYTREKTYLNKVFV